MKRKPTILGVIPARGGSKGVPRKNIRKVNGKPLIIHAIECGLSCPSLNRLIVSTDCQEIADIARTAGAEVPFLRPIELALDDTPMLPVLKHAIQEVENIYKEDIDWLVLIDPTAPLRTTSDVEGAISLALNSECDAVVSGHSARRNPFFNMVIKREGYYGLVVETKKEVSRRQDAPDVFDLNTVVWVYRKDTIVITGERIPSKTLLYQIPDERALDLDSEFDFKQLEMMLRKNGSYGL